jgi:hypothetical protein
MKPFDTHSPEINAAMHALAERTLPLSLTGLEAMMLHGLIQTVLRHPHLPDTTRHHARGMCAVLKEWLAEDTRLLPLLNAGEDVRQDEAPLPEVVVGPGQIPALYAVLVETPVGEEVLFAGGNQRIVVSWDLEELPLMRQCAREAADYSHYPVRLVRFFARETIEEVTP